jgi:hypothetical protein
LSVLPQRLFVEQISVMRESEKAALPAPMIAMVVMGSPFVPKLWSPPTIAEDLQALNTASL